MLLLFDLWLSLVLLKAASPEQSHQDRWVDLDPGEIWGYLALMFRILFIAFATALFPALAARFAFPGETWITELFVHFSLAFWVARYFFAGPSFLKGARGSEALAMASDLGRGKRWSLFLVTLLSVSLPSALGHYFEDLPLLNFATDVSESMLSTAYVWGALSALHFKASRP